MVIIKLNIINSIVKVIKKLTKHEFVVYRTYTRYYHSPIDVRLVVFIKKIH